MDGWRCWHRAWCCLAAGLALVLAAPRAHAAEAGAPATSATSGPAAYRTVAKSCHPDCGKLGNCNLETGACECPFGWGGEDCTTPLLPACRQDPSSPGAPLLTGWKHPKNCFCYRQLLAHTCLADMHGRCQHLTTSLWGELRCYQHTSFPEDRQLSAFPEQPDDPSVEWYRGTVSFKYPPEGVVAPVQEFKNFTKLDRAPGAQELGHSVALSRCTNKCNGYGMCTGGGVCLCVTGRNGRACEGGDPSACPISCSGRGECLGGFCKCTPPYWGIGCARQHAYAPAAGVTPLPSYTALRIYIYDLPMHVRGPWETDDGAADVYVIYQAFKHLLNRLLTDDAVRTENPWEANLFYIPAFVFHATANLGDPTLAVTRAVEWVQSAFPFYNRSQGRDHVVAMSGDRGACYLKPSPLTDPLIKLVHFGMEKANITDMGALVQNKEYGCFKNGRDVVMAPYFRPKAAIVESVHRRLAEPGGAEAMLAEKEVLFFFSGDIRHNEPEYSGGVRQDLAKILENHSYPDVVFKGGYMPLAGAEYEGLLARTKFCMAPYGHGWGIRLSHALMHGCVPVIVQDHVHQPFEDLLSYPDFSVRVRRSELPRLVDILRGVPQEDILRMMRGTNAVHRAFLWQQELGGLAYNYTIDSLRRRLTYLRGDLYEW